MAELSEPFIATVIEAAPPDEGKVIVLRGELDFSTADSVRDAVDQVLATEPSEVVFDMSGLSFMDSSGIAVFVYAVNHAGKVELRHPTNIVRRIIEVTGLSHTFSVVP